MSMARLFRILREKRRLDKSLRIRKAVRKIRSEAALKGKITEHANRVKAHQQMWGAQV